MNKIDQGRTQGSSRDKTLLGSLQLHDVDAKNIQPGNSGGEACDAELRAVSNVDSKPIETKIRKRNRFLSPTLTTTSTSPFARLESELENDG